MITFRAAVYTERCNNESGGAPGSVPVAGNSNDARADETKQKVFGRTKRHEPK